MEGLKGFVGSGSLLFPTVGWGRGRVLFSTGSDGEEPGRTQVVGRGGGGLIFSLKLTMLERVTSWIGEGLQLNRLAVQTSWRVGEMG